MLTSDKHSNLLGQLLSYEEDEILWIHTQISKVDKNKKISAGTFRINSKGEQGPML